eukprot:1245187-Prymnesium_polylepis.1
MKRVRVHRTPKASRSTATRHTAMGKTPDIRSSTTMPVMTGSTSAGTSAGGGVRGRSCSKICGIDVGYSTEASAQRANPATSDAGGNRPGRNPVCASHQEQLRNLACDVEVDHIDDNERQEQSKAKEDEEDVHIVGAVAYAIGLAHIGGHLARLHEKHAGVHEDEAQHDHGHQPTILDTLVRLHRQLQRKEGDAEK